MDFSKINNIYKKCFFFWGINWSMCENIIVILMEIAEIPPRADSITTENKLCLFTDWLHAIVARCTYQLEIGWLNVRHFIFTCLVLVSITRDYELICAFRYVRYNSYDFSLFNILSQRHERTTKKAAATAACIRRWCMQGKSLRFVLFYDIIHMKLSPQETTN